MKLVVFSSLFTLSGVGKNVVSWTIENETIYQERWLQKCNYLTHDIKKFRKQKGIKFAESDFSDYECLKDQAGSDFVLNTDLDLFRIRIQIIPKRRIQFPNLEFCRTQLWSWAGGLPQHWAHLGEDRHVLVSGRFMIILVDGWLVQIPCARVKWNRLFNLLLTATLSPLRTTLFLVP